jgi:hypothetical protein
VSKNKDIEEILYPNQKDSPEEFVIPSSGRYFESQPLINTVKEEALCAMRSVSETWSRKTEK